MKKCKSQMCYEEAVTPADYSRDMKFFDKNKLDMSNIKNAKLFDAKNMKQ